MDPDCSRHRAIIRRCATRTSRLFQRRINVLRHQVVGVSAQTILPDSTLSTPPWLPSWRFALGGETLSDLSWARAQLLRGRLAAGEAPVTRRATA